MVTTVKTSNPYINWTYSKLTYGTGKMKRNEEKYCPIDTPHSRFPEFLIKNDREEIQFFC
jgi:hypothetical protein